VLLLLAVAEEFGLDVVLGAFLAGIGMLGENAAAWSAPGPVGAGVPHGRGGDRAPPPGGRHPGGARPVESRMSNLPRFRAVSP